MGPRNVATGEAERNPWKASSDPAPDRAEESSPGAVPMACQDRQRRQRFPRPSGARVLEMLNHGLRGDGSAAAPLHPWLQSGAPSGAQMPWVAAEARTM